MQQALFREIAVIPPKFRHPKHVYSGMLWSVNDSLGVLSCLLKAML